MLVHDHENAVTWKVEVIERGIETQNLHSGGIYRADLDGARLFVAVFFVFGRNCKRVYSSVLFLKYLK